MAFVVQNISVDLIHGQATMVAFDNPPPPAPGQQPQQPKMVQISFPFAPPNQEGKEKDKAIAAAKAVLQQALNEIS
jgi:hypothetical protein